METSSRTRKEIIKRYAKKCINDEIPSCVKHKWACERALKDFDRMAAVSSVSAIWMETKERRSAKIQKNVY